jgi:hypothetical protein
MLPFKEKFEYDIMSSVYKIEEQIIDYSTILDFEGTLRDVEKYGFKIKLIKFCLKQLTNNLNQLK